MAARSGVSHYRAGPHLPSGQPATAASECFRCADDRRILWRYEVLREGAIVGTMRLCQACATEMARPDPDPLTLAEVAG